ERDSLAARGSFMGEVTAHTDGIALHAATTAAFPFGALFAVHDDQAVAAFDLGDVVRALALDADCAPGGRWVGAARPVAWPETKSRRPLRASGWYLQVAPRVRRGPWSCGR